LNRHRLLGLTIHSDFPLPAPLAQEHEAPELTARWGDVREVTGEPAPGELIFDMTMASYRCTVSKTPGEYVIRYADHCEATVNKALTSATLHPASEGAREMAVLLFSGNVISKILMLRGDCILHGSAVEVDGRGLLIIGKSGTGKSTLAALLSSAGCQLLSDDVVRLIPREGKWICPTGTSEIRLREKAASLGSMLPGTVRQTIDQRTGVTLQARDMQVPVSCLVFPRPSKDATNVTVMRLGQEEAVMRLTAAPRVLGWQDPALLKQYFRYNARLAREIPAFDVTVPWGPPFRREVAEELLQLLPRT
jgi:hypothetical protein